MQNLTGRQREVWQYYHNDGATCIEIAEQLGITEKVVRKHLKAATRNLSKESWGEVALHSIDPQMIDEMIVEKNEDGTWCEVSAEKCGGGYRRVDVVDHG